MLFSKMFLIVFPLLYFLLRYLDYKKGEQIVMILFLIYCIFLFFNQKET